MPELSSLHGAGYRLVIRQPTEGDEPDVLADLFGPDGKINRDDANIKLRIVGEEERRGVAVDPAMVERILGILDVARADGQSDIEALREAPLRIYTRTASTAEPPNPDMKERLGALGDALLVSYDFASKAEMPPEMKDTPAAYTYLGQFLAHELTLWKEVDPPSPGAPALIMDSAIDLKTIFLRPFDFPQHLPPHVQEVEGLALGETCPNSEPGLFGAGLVDLPRLPGGKAMLFEKRNDQNLAVSQTHVAITRFVQAALRILGGGNSLANRQLILRHFQSVVLQDYLQRIIDPETWTDVMERGRVVIAPVLKALPNDMFFVPAEFSGAVFKFGHAMRKDSYSHWNVFNIYKPVDPANSSDLLKETFGGGKLHEGRLEQNWVTDWRFFLGLGCFEPDKVRARAIDTTLSKALFCLPERLFQSRNDDRVCLYYGSGNINLARRTLLAGADLLLPTGQDYAREVQAKLDAAGSKCKIPILAPQDLIIPGNADATELMEAGPLGHRFVDQTPLWVYILRESAVIGGGNKLGPLGGRIVAETISAAIEASKSGMIVDGIRQHFTVDPRFKKDGGDVFTLKDLVELAFDHAF